ncbi:MAG: bifunctional phosphoribosylaminoimidazolecarboxamide formyltransferase/IMP cyclohydrolase, partial [Ignavibacteria bacterium]|nr:bifunctional phosphoribosylaminoimidazolecarboxamide formyltransferase/IMP cyclohydrolase [Ignavibacteria bacterium]
MIDKLKIKNALVSVFDKEGLVEFCKELKKFEINIYSTGGTYEYLKSSNIDVKSVSEITELPSLLDGRVKTLHPFIHSAILADKNSEKHLKELESLGIQPFDLVVINFYPFESAVQNPNATEDELVEKIDIGGPTMVRSSAKNFGSVCVLCDKSQYQDFLLELKENVGSISFSSRRKFASLAFQRICEYDSAISNYFNKDEVYNFNLSKAMSLRYGENPHQNAAIYGDFFDYFEPIHGKELSYNNILDIVS